MATVQAPASDPSQAIYASLNNTQAKTGAKEASPQDRFLKLLVTQLRNQDPLNPMDNAQMTSQLAELSTVDGINKLDATLQALIDGSNQSQAMQAATLVGHGVLVPGAGMTLQDGLGIGGIELAGPADRVAVTIKDASGLVVRTIDLGAMEPGSTAFTWDGMTDSAVKAADGSYTVSIKATRGVDDVDVKALQVGVVSSVARTGQGVSLSVGALGAFLMSDIRGIL